MDTKVYAACAFTAGPTWVVVMVAAMVTGSEYTRLVNRFRNSCYLAPKHSLVDGVCTIGASWVGGISILLLEVSVFFRCSNA